MSEAKKSLWTLETAALTRGTNYVLTRLGIGTDLSHSRPLGFRCTITPRDDRAKELIIAANMAA
jgi:hypothetical protein